MEFGKGGTLFSRFILFTCLVR